MCIAKLMITGKLAGAPAHNHMKYGCFMQNNFGCLDTVYKTILRCVY